MRFFADDTTKPLLKERGCTRVLEIGASFGRNTEMILGLEGIQLTIIDPCIDLDLAAQFGEKVKVHKGLSLDVLPTITDTFDCIFVDGDHNWYTVFHELQLIEQHRLLNKDGIIFLHDVCWPYGRRDMYYQPETVPAEFRKPYSRNGMEKGKATLVDSGGFNIGHWNALTEGGPKNGVLTAVEDFIGESTEKYHLIIDDRQWGLGIVFRRTARDSKKLVQRLRSQIFRRKHIEPKLQAWRQLVLSAKMSKIGCVLRKIRNTIRGI